MTGAPSPDPIAVAQLRADQCQPLATLGVAGAGGMFVLLQAQLPDTGGRWWPTLVLFVATTILSMYGQIVVVVGSLRHTLADRHGWNAQ